MSSRDKASKAKTSHKGQTTIKHQSSSSSNNSNIKTVSRNNGNTKNSSSSGKTTNSEKRPINNSSRQSTKVQTGGLKNNKRATNLVGSPTKGLQKFTEFKEQDISSENSRRNSSEMATTSFPNEVDSLLSERLLEQETDVDETTERLISPKNIDLEGEEEEDDDEDEDQENTRFLIGNSSKDVNNSPPSSKTIINDTLPPGWEQHVDKAGAYFWHISTGVIQRTKPNSELPSELLRRGSSIVVYHDDEEINQAPKSSSDDEEDYYESGAALTAALSDDSSESTFVVYPLGCCEFDETQLMSATSSKAIQKCILRLSNKPQSEEETVCWGLDQSQPILMKLFDDHIQFTNLKTQLLLRSQPIQTIKTWAVDDNNNFAFVIEDQPSSTPEAGRGEKTGGYYCAATSDDVDYALISEPVLMCYVFRSIDEDDMMSCKVAAKLNEEINRYKEQMLHRMTKSTRLQQMVVDQEGDEGEEIVGGSDLEDFDELEASNELTMNVKYIGKFPVPRPTGIEILNVAIDKCLAEATSRSNKAKSMNENENGNENLEYNESQATSPLIEAKLHVSPSSVIVENVLSGEIIVECRIRYLTFMGISKRDIRWCGFIMQNETNKTFVAHCFECHPTAGHVCEAIQLSCTRMYEKVVKNSQQNHHLRNQDLPETMSIIPSGSRIRNTLAKTFSKIKLNPLTR